MMEQETLRFEGYNQTKNLMLVLVFRWQLDTWRYLGRFSMFKTEWLAIKDKPCFFS